MQKTGDLVGLIKPEWFMLDPNFFFPRQKKKCKSSTKWMKEMKEDRRINAEQDERNEEGR